MRLTGRRKWMYRIMAIHCGLLPFVLVEAGLRLTGVAAPQPVPDPFVSFTQVRPLFKLSKDGDQFITDASRQPFFKIDSFSARKSPEEYRIFCLGGSTVQGNPYSIETSFTTWLELDLQAADPSRKWEVVNCGGISYASYRLAPILRECLQYQPDLFILYLGDNEFLEERSYASIKQSSPAVVWLSRCASRSHLFQLASQTWMAQSSGSKNSPGDIQSLTAEVNALLDYQGGLDQYRRDDDWRKGVTDHFAYTLASMVQEARSAEVPVLLVDPVSNIKDCPPFKAEFEADLTAQDRQQLEELLKEAKKQESDLEHRIAILEKARQLDSRHAGIQYLLGHAYLEASRGDLARTALFQAKDEDICPLRMTESLREVIYAVGESSNTPIALVLKEFEQRSPHGIPGDELMLDHVHPTISGHQIIADILVTTMHQQRWIHVTDGWRRRQRDLYRQHLATIDAPYYARGQEHLEGLRLWSKGRVKKLKQPQ